MASARCRLSLLALPLALAVTLATPAVSGAVCGTTLRAQTASKANLTGSDCALTNLIVSPNPLDPGVDPTLTATFDASGSTDTTGTQADIASYAWDFGDGGPGAITVVGVDPSPDVTTHPYPGRGHYVARVTTRDSGDAPIATSVSVDVYVSATPIAVLGAPAGTLRPGVAYNFDGGGSTAPGIGASIAHYVWDWDDGTTTDTASASTQHTFAANGTPHVTLTVVNDVGLASAAASQDLTVQNQLPLAQLIATPSTVSVGQSLTLSAAGSSDLDGSIAQYRWDLDGNGSFETSTGTTAQVTAGPYPNPGVLHPRVQVVDDSGGVGIASVPVTVLDPTGGGGSGSGGSGGSQTGGAGGGGAGGGSSSAGSTDAFALGLSGTAIQRLTGALRRGIGLHARANRAASGTLTLTVSPRDARKLHLARRARKPVAIGTLRLKLRAGRTAKPSIKLTRKAARALRRMRPRLLRVTIRGTIAARTAHVSAVRVVLLRG